MATKAIPDEVVPGSTGGWSEPPESDTVGDRMLSVYRSVRLPGALAAGLGNLVLTFVFEWAFGWLAVAAASVAAVDAVRERRWPRKLPAATILIDATLIGLTMVAVGLPAVSFAFGLWIVLLTAVLASGWWRLFLYSYIAAWAVLANLVTWSGVREWTQFEVLILDWTALLLVGALVVGLVEVALRRIRQVEAERNYMVGLVGHELGNALTSVTSMAQTLERHRDRLEPDMAASMIGSIRVQAQESADIAQDLLTLAQIRQDALRIETILVDGWEETAEVARRVSETTGVPIAISEQLDCPIMVDPLRFRQVVRNLLINAVDYGEGAVSVRVAVQGDHAKIGVIDEGPGIPSAEIENLFEPHQPGTSSSHRTGSGLGLWISRRLAREMGGELTYRGQESGYTVFEAVFPLAPAEV